MNYSQYAMIFAVLAFLWSVMTFYKVDNMAKEQQKVSEQIDSFLNPPLSLPEEDYDNGHVR
jgi:hypothetical protein